ncbi:Uncharacterised protein [Chromobacterium violaceum]|uniref:4Fe-4S ferredoxin-type domain-containing protein n=1 Tax=Chromobacterium violaceum TaxID=536 RepID=A0A447T7K0_CHRVL|nr:Uncharacterised protein [Chromobacterium violaceum]
MANRQVVWLKAEAPAKPPPGLPCNGCGVCCAAAPCPCRDCCWAQVRFLPGAGMASAALSLRPAAHAAPPSAPPARLDRILVPPLARRYLAIGRGCDSLATTEEDR